MGWPSRSRNLHGFDENVCACLLKPEFEQRRATGLSISGHQTCRCERSVVGPITVSITSPARRCGYNSTYATIRNCCCSHLIVAGGNAADSGRQWSVKARSIPGNAAFPCSAPGRFSCSNRGASAPAQPEPTEGVSQGQQAQGSWLWCRSGVERC